LAILLTTVVTRNNPSAGSRGVGPGNKAPSGGAAGEAPAPSRAVMAAVVHDAHGSSALASTTRAYRGFGWIDHDHRVAGSGEQMAFGIVRACALVCQPPMMAIGPRGCRPVCCHVCWPATILQPDDPKNASTIGLCWVTLMLYSLLQAARGGAVR
jgi:hypothetical protein